MVELDPSTAVPNIVFGSVVILMSLLAIRFRKWITEATIAHERRILPKRGADDAAALQSPFWVGVAGVSGVILGLIMLGYGFVALTM